MPRWLTSLVCALLFFPPIGMTLLTLWPLLRLGGSFIARDLEAFALAGLAAGVSLLLAVVAADQAHDPRR